MPRTFDDAAQPAGRPSRRQLRDEQLKVEIA
jgi:hypothetical protein